MSTTSSVAPSLRSTRRCTRADPSRPCGSRSSPDATTYVPLPRRRSTSPSATRASYAATAVPRPMASVAATARSEGRRVPPSRAPRSMALATDRSSLRTSGPDPSAHAPMASTKATVPLGREVALFGMCQLCHSPSMAIELDPRGTLGFGRYYTDHMAVAGFERSRGWDPFEVVPYGALSLSPAAMGLHYGQSIFEGLKAYRQPDGSVALFRP